MKPYRTYTEVVARAARQMFSSYMSGSNDLGIDDSGLIAWAYDVPSDKFESDVDLEYRRIRNDYYASKRVALGVDK
jgi:hypothetical protein